MVKNSKLHTENSKSFPSNYNTENMPIITSIYVCFGVNISKEMCPFTNGSSIHVINFRRCLGSVKLDILANAKRVRTAEERVQVGEIAILKLLTLSFFPHSLLSIIKRQSRDSPPASRLYGCCSTPQSLNPDALVASDTITIIFTASQRFERYHRIVSPNGTSDSRNR
jgi:hypothetical protein